MEETNPTGAKSNVQFTYFGSACVFFFVFVFVNLFVLWFVTSEKTVYSYEEMGHWLRFLKLGGLLYTDPTQAVTIFFQALREYAWNYFVILPVALFYPLIGTARLHYILGIANTLLLPAIFSFFPLHSFLSEKAGIPQKLGTEHPVLKMLLQWIPLIIGALAMRLWFPVLNGTGDVGGVIFLNIILYIAFMRLDQRRKWWHLPCMAILMAAVIFYRRWYSIWIAGFFIASALNSIILALTTRQIAVFKRALSDLLLPALLFFALVAIVSLPFLLQILGIKSVDADSAWQISNPTWPLLIKRFIRYHGYVPMSAFFAGMIWMIASKQTRLYGVFICVQFATTFFLFERIQDFSTFHHYLLIPDIIIGCSFFLAKLASVFQQKPPVAVAVLLLGLMMFLLNFLYIFFPRFSSLGVVFRTLSPAYVTYPEVRTDIGELLRLNEALYSLVLNQNKKIMVLPDSPTLNHFALYAMSYSLPQANSLSPYLQQPSFADRRDGFPSHLFSVDFVLVSDPIQLNLKPQDQQVLVLPSKMIMSQTGIGTSFEKLPYQFTLGKNVKVYIYKRVKPFRKEDIQALSDALKKLYPDDPFVYTPKISSQYVN